jgi:hypothetical protein
MIQTDYMSARQIVDMAKDEFDLVIPLSTVCSEFDYERRQNHRKTIRFIPHLVITRFGRFRMATTESVRFWLNVKKSRDVISRMVSVEINEFAAHHNATIIRHKKTGRIFISIPSATNPDELLYDVHRIRRREGAQGVRITKEYYETLSYTALHDKYTEKHHEPINS